MGGGDLERCLVEDVLLLHFEEEGVEEVDVAGAAEDVEGLVGGGGGVGEVVGELGVEVEVVDGAP